MKSSTHTSRKSLLLEAARSAGLAPSVHNTQPWVFVVDDDRIDVVADETRRLHSLDPLGRELAISCGSALFNIRVILDAWGYQATVERVPEPERPELLARVTLGPVSQEASSIGALEPVLEVRRTNRRRFSPGAVPDDAVTCFEAIAEQEHAVLFPITTQDHRLAVARLTQEADQIQNGSAAYRAELRTWTTADPTRHDGVPTNAIPHVDGTGVDDVPIRDFDTAGVGALPADTHSSRDQCLLLLGTDSDDLESWIRAGEAQEHIWLEATRRGFAVSPLTQMTEVPRVRNELRRDLNLSMHPHSLLRVGRALSTPPTPRRSTDDTIRVASPTT